MPLVKVIRHAHSTANDANVPEGSAADLAFANRNAEISDRGKGQCVAFARTLREHGIDVKRTPVAVSEYTRTKQTALLLGFPEELIKVYPVLNEVDYGMDLTALRESLRKNEIPPIAFAAVRKSTLKVLQNQPPEKIWITHGLLIAGLTHWVEAEYERLVPRQCEMRYLPL